NARVLLLKDFSEVGFTFFTNYDSRKGIELAENPQGHLLFFWDELQRQIRIEGQIQKVSRKESEEYFQSRPRGSQIGAIASPQSCEIEDRLFLENKKNTIESEMNGIENLPCPQNWGGYILKPHRFEFWQGRMNRLHDRIIYENDGGVWKIGRLAP
ncbi:MAG TPA: pyridoxamine 5'-phosphate oxidase, partial [Flavobacteriales bacterium]|nr:pyridoxamine 5'-phosphate oxidase [Flavobacteriales bacterium]